MFSLEQFFRLNFRVGVSVADVSNPYVAVGVNDDLCDLFGRSRDELMEPGIFGHISHPDDRARELPMMRELLSGEREQYGLVKRFTRGDGQTVRAWVEVTLIRDDAGHPAKAIGTIIAKDTTSDSWERAQKLLEHRRGLLRMLAEADDELAQVALQITDDENVTRRELARAFGVGLATVQAWIDRAKALR